MQLRSTSPKVFRMIFLNILSRAAASLSSAHLLRFLIPLSPCRSTHVCRLSCLWLVCVYMCAFIPTILRILHSSIFPSPFIEHSGGVARLDAGGRLDESLDKIQGASTNVPSTLGSERNGVIENHFLVNEKKGHFLTPIILIISLFYFVEFISH